MVMSKIIIGIHGLGNKPPQRMLELWWNASIREGLKEIGKTEKRYNFILVYWADHLYQTPLSPEITDKKHSLYLEEPYIPGRSAKEVKAGKFREKILHYLEGQMERIFLNDDLTINYSSITDFIIHHFFSDLERYYSARCTGHVAVDCWAKDAICSHLAAVLKRHRRKKILLIAHSMGSIIAYDVLTQFAPAVPIDTFVTIGSPLGLPIIKRRLVAEKKEKSSKMRLKTPENVMSKWYNLSDLSDKIAFDYGLSDDFEENARHVRVIDKIVSNNYEYEGNRNPHKSYGYLRTPELAEIVARFLQGEPCRPLIWLKNLFRRHKAD